MDESKGDTSADESGGARGQPQSGGLPNTSGVWTKGWGTVNLVCLDLEGVLVPEIWVAFAEATGIPELKRTTRDEPDYDKLMAFRLGLLKERGLGLRGDPGHHCRH